MYGLPETFDSSFLKGKEIQSVCFAAYQVNIQFSGNAWIAIESGYRLQCGDNVLEVVSAFPISHSSLLGLIGKKIVEISFSSKSGDIKLLLENKMNLFIQGDTGPYESYRLFDGQNETIV